MDRKKKAKGGKKSDVCGSSTRLDPETSLTPKYDAAGVRKFPVADRKQMGFRVVDDFVEEHIN